MAKNKHLIVTTSFSTRSIHFTAGFRQGQTNPAHRQRHCRSSTTTDGINGPGCHKAFEKRRHEGLLGKYSGPFFSRPACARRIAEWQRFSAEWSLVSLNPNWLAKNIIAVTVAEASGSRTHRRRGYPPSAGFEDRTWHRPSLASSF